MDKDRPLLGNKSSLTERLNYYAYSTKDVDIPTNHKSVDEFWYAFGKILACKTFKVTASSLLSNSDFYKKLENNQATINEKIDFINFLNGYNAKVLKNSTKYILLENDKTALEGDAPLPSEPIEPQPQPQTVEQPNETEQNSNAESINKPQEQSVQQPPKPEPPSKVEEASTADLAKSLTPEAENRIARKMFEMQQEAEEQRRKEAEIARRTYKYTDNYGSNYTTKDIYSNKILQEAMARLYKGRRLIIVAPSGSGKSELANLLTEKITGEKISLGSSDTGNTMFERVCLVNGGNSVSLMVDDEYRVGELIKFIEHIKNNNITEPCVFICNEVQEGSSVRMLLGPALFEQFSSPDKPAAMLPENLYIIFTACKGADFVLDDQVFDRLGKIELEYISTNNNSIDKAKLTQAFGNDARAEKIINLVSQINDNEGSIRNRKGMISTRNLIAKLEDSETLALSGLTLKITQSQKLFKELRAL